MAISKRELLLKKFSEELQKIVSQEELIVQDLLALEPQRLALVEEITGNQNATLDELAGFFTGKEAGELVEIADKLKNTVYKIKDLNESNQNLLQQALELTQYSIKLITKVPSEATYGSGGKSQPKKSSLPALIDRKA